MEYCKTAKGKSSTGMLARLVVNHSVTGPVPVEFMEDLWLCSPKIWATELHGWILFLLTGAYQGGEHTNT